MNPPTHDAWVVEDPTLCPLCGRDACEDHVPVLAIGNDVTDRSTLADDGLSPTPSTVPILPGFVAATALLDEPAPSEIVEGIVFQQGITALIGPSGDGKTFVAIDLAASVSGNVAWHGLAVRGGSVAYCLFEGDGIGPRLRAIAETSGQRLDHLHFIRMRDPLSPCVGRDGETASLGEITVRHALSDLAARLQKADEPPVVLVVIDTVRASLAGSEDHSEHVASYLRVVRRLLSCVPDAAGLLVHHTGWQDSDAPRKRERGSSAWRGNVDVTLYLEAGDYHKERGEAQLTLRALKVRDGEPPLPLALVRRRVHLLAHGHQGKPCTSCVIESDGRTQEDRETAAAATVAEQDARTDRLVLKAIAERPDATSQERLGTVLNIRKNRVAASLSRLLQKGFIVFPSRQRQPYSVTASGVAALEMTTGSQ